MCALARRKNVLCAYGTRVHGRCTQTCVHGPWLCVQWSLEICTIWGGHIRKPQLIPLIRSNVRSITRDSKDAGLIACGAIFTILAVSDCSCLFASPTPARKADHAGGDLRSPTSRPRRPQWSLCLALTCDRSHGILMVPSVQ